MPESVIQRSMSAGELAPVLHARADHEKYTSGLKTCRNFMVLRHGAVANRPGFRFVAECKTTSANVRLLRYVSENPNESILIEAGVNYFRFYLNGALVSLAGAATAWSGATAYVEGDLVSRLGVNYYCVLAHTNQQPPNATYWHPLTGLIYEIPSPYTTGGLFNWVQSGNVITLTHRLHDPRELIYFGLTNWVLRLATTEPAQPAPLNVAATAGAAGARTYTYLVTAAAAETYEESLPSTAFVLASTAAPTPDLPNVVTWDAVIAPVDEPAEWYVYLDPYGNGTFGFIGTASDETFNDVGFVPDFAITSPLPRTPFVSAETRPHVATYYQQRRFFAGSTATPETIEGSRTGFPNNFGISSPLQDDDALSFRISGDQHHPVRHMLGLKTLLVLTDGGGWTVGQPKIALTPSNLPADQETYVGAAPDVRPVVIGNSVIYLQSRGSIIRDLRFEIEVEGLAGRDLTVFAAHLFDGHEIDRMDYQQTPHSVVWAIRDDGVLLGLTYLREQDIWGWHRHDTDGFFEQICVVPEGSEDAVYVIVMRTIGGSNKRYIERLATREITSFDVDSFFVDSGLSYSGAPASSFGGLTHLEGESVVGLADGEPVGPFTVAGGSVSLGAAASNVHIGLPIPSADFETLNLDVGGSAIRDKKKRVGSLTVIVDKSSRVFLAGPDTTHLTRYELSQLSGAAVDEHTGHVEMTLSATWNEHGRVFIRQDKPLPLTVLGVLPNLVIGG